MASPFPTLLILSVCLLCNQIVSSKGNLSTGQLEADVDDLKALTGDCKAMESLLKREREERSLLMEIMKKSFTSVHNNVTGESRRVREELTSSMRLVENNLRNSVDLAEGRIRSLVNIKIADMLDEVRRDLVKRMDHMTGTLTQKILESKTVPSKPSEEKPEAKGNATTFS